MARAPKIEIQLAPEDVQRFREISNRVQRRLIDSMAAIGRACQRSANRMGVNALRDLQEQLAAQRVAELEAYFADDVRKTHGITADDIPRPERELAATRAELDVCTDCRGTGEYRGLLAVEVCGTCQGRGRVAVEESEETGSPSRSVVARGDSFAEYRIAHPAGMGETLRFEAVLTGAHVAAELQCVDILDGRELYTTRALSTAAGYWISRDTILRLHADGRLFIIDPGCSPIRIPL